MSGGPSCLRQDSEASGARRRAATPWALPLFVCEKSSEKEIALIPGKRIEAAKELEERLESFKLTSPGRRSRTVKNLRERFSPMKTRTPTLFRGAGEL